MINIEELFEYFISLYYKNMLHYEVIIPCYNEEKNLHNTLPQLEHFFTHHYPHRRITFVNDGSKDNTL